MGIRSFGKYLIPVFEGENEGTTAIADPPAPVVEAVPEAEPAPEPEPAPAPKPRLADPLINTITGLRSKNREIEAERDQARREAADARALADRLSKGEKAEQPATQPRAPAPDDAEIDRRAEYKLFLRDVEGVRQKGMQEFGPQFNDTISALNAVGAAENDFVQQIMDVDPANAHALLHAIAQDLSVATELVNMAPGKRVAKLTRMAMAAAPKNDPAPEPAPKVAASKVSKAPAPAPALTPSASKVIDWRDDSTSDKDFYAGMDEMLAKRAEKRNGALR